jgi:hypothetical protein
LRAGSFSVVRVSWVISSVCALELLEISPTLVHVPGALFRKQKGTLLVREPGNTLFELKYFFIFTMRLAQRRLN